MMKVGKLNFLLTAAIAIVTGFAATGAMALDFDTIVFADDFEGFADGYTVSAAGNDAPSTGVGSLWQYVGTGGAQAEVTTAQSYGPGTKSLQQTRSGGNIPRYWTYPDVVPEANVTANSVFGIQYDMNLASIDGSLTGINHGIAPGGAAALPGSIVSYGDGEVRVWDSVLGGYTQSGYFFGEGWQTVETTFEMGADLGGTANALVTVFLTRDNANSAGGLSRTQIYQSNETLVLDNNWRADFYNNGAGQFNLDNVVLGTVSVVPEPGSIAMIICLALPLAAVVRQRYSRS